MSRGMLVIKEPALSSMLPIVSALDVMRVSEPAPVFFKAVTLIIPLFQTYGCVVLLTTMLGVVAVMVTLVVPVVVGVPEIKPVLVFTDRPAGSRPVTLKLVGLLVAVIW